MSGNDGLVLAWMGYAFVLGAIVGGYAYGHAFVRTLQRRNARLLADLEHERTVNACGSRA